MWYNFLKNIPSDPNFLLLAFLFGLACNLIKPVDRTGVPTWGVTANKRTGLAPGDAVNIKGKRTAEIVAVFAKNISQAKMRTIIFQVTYVLVQWEKSRKSFNTLSANLTKWSNKLTVRRLMPTNCLSVFDYFMSWRLKI